MVTAQKVSIGKRSYGEFVIKTEGMHVITSLSKKSDIQSAIKNSKAHQWLIDNASKTPKTTIAKTSQLPSTQTQDFATKAFYISVKGVVESLVEVEGFDIDRAIVCGNSLMLGNPVVGNTDVVIWKVKDALSYGQSAGIF